MVDFMGYYLKGVAKALLVMLAVVLALVIGTFITSRVFAQGPETVAIIERVFTATTLATTSAPIRNIGQSLHVIVIEFPTAVGAVAPIQVRVEGSFDNTLYFPIMDDVVTVPLLGGRVYSINKANGVYPYVRVRSLVATPGALPMRLSYVGHVYSVLPVARQGVDRFLL